MVLVYGAVSISPACVGEVATHAPLEETLASLARVLAVMLSTRLIPAHL